MTEQYATDTSDSNDTTKDEEEKPIQVEVINQPKEKEKKNYEDTEELYDYIPTDEQIKEMTDAQ